MKVPNQRIKKIRGVYIIATRFNYVYLKSWALVFYSAAQKQKSECGTVVFTGGAAALFTH